jgi:hypothetical protein
METEPVGQEDRKDPGMLPAGPGSANGPARALAVTSVFPDAKSTKEVGAEHYSYFQVYQIFAPLLKRWGQVIPVTHPESRIDYTVWRARRRSLEPLHLSFLPLHRVYLARSAPNVAVPAWEFPDLPAKNFHGNPRENWMRMAERVDLIITHTQFSRHAFARAGVTTPVHVVPVPVPDEYFATPPWEPSQRFVLDCPCFTLPVPEPRPAAAAANSGSRHRRSIRQFAKSYYQRYGRGWLPPPVDRLFTRLVKRARRGAAGQSTAPRAAAVNASSLDLGGIVYTSILNPRDARKNWKDMLSAYLLALADCEDATLVIKLVVEPMHSASAMEDCLAYYRSMGIRHRCKLAFIPSYLTPAQMQTLVQATTYYLNTSRAEGSCLPLQNYLAAGRPGIAPAHTGMADYFHAGLGFVVASHPEPTCWPQDPTGQYTTTWHRLVWQSLYDQLRQSYAVSRFEMGHYQELAQRSREQLRSYAGRDVVWPLLRAALDAGLDSQVLKSAQAAKGLPAHVRRSA